MARTSSLPMMLCAGLTVVVVLSIAACSPSPPATSGGCVVESRVVLADGKVAAEATLTGLCVAYRATTYFDLFDVSTNHIELYLGFSETPNDALKRKGRVTRLRGHSAVVMPEVYHDDDRHRESRTISSRRPRTCEPGVWAAVLETRTDRFRTYNAHAQMRVPAGGCDDDREVVATAQPADCPEVIFGGTRRGVLVTVEEFTNGELSNSYEFCTRR